MVNAQLAQSVNQNDIDTHRKQVANTLRQANPDYEKHVDVDDTFSKSVGKDIVGGKAYWAKCFQEVIAMAVEHGVPQFFVTFTANEMMMMIIHVGDKASFQNARNESWEKEREPKREARGDAEELTETRRSPRQTKF